MYICRDDVTDDQGSQTPEPRYDTCEERRNCGFKPRAGKAARQLPVAGRCGRRQAHMMRSSRSEVAAMRRRTSQAAAPRGGRRAAALPGRGRSRLLGGAAGRLPGRVLEPVALVGVGPRALGLVALVLWCFEHGRARQRRCWVTTTKLASARRQARVGQSCTRPRSGARAAPAQGLSKHVWRGRGQRRRAHRAGGGEGGLEGVHGLLEVVLARLGVEGAEDGAGPASRAAGGVRP